MKRIQPEYGEDKPVGWFYYTCPFTKREAIRFKLGIYGGRLHIPPAFTEWFIRVPFVNTLIVIGHMGLEQLPVDEFTV